MTFTPKFSGIWYGIPCHIGMAVDVPEALVRKAQSRPDMFDAEKPVEPRKPVKRQVRRVKNQG